MWVSRLIGYTGLDDLEGERLSQAHIIYKCNKSED